MIRIDVKVDADQATDAFKRARRDMSRRARSGMKRAGEQTILPLARSAVAQKTPVQPGKLVVKTTTTFAYMTATNVKEGRKIGLLNYGGTVRPPIEPRKRKALAFNGVVVSRVNTVRRYRAQHFLEDARDRKLDEFGQALLPELLLAFTPLEHSP